MPDLGSASSTWTAEIVGRVVIRSQSSVSDVKTVSAKSERVVAKRWSSLMSW